MGVLVAGYVLSAVASIAGQSSILPGNSYASIAALPDWGGAWVVPFEAFTTENARQRDPKDPSAPLLTPDYAAMQAAFNNRDNPTRRPSNNETCLPSGMPNVMRYAFAIEFVFSPGRVTMLLEQDSMVRRIYTDGRAHTDDPDVSYAGDSIGHWEAETLVVDTTAITHKAELRAGVKTSGQAHVRERIHLKDKDHLQIDTVVEDPIALKAPWRYSRIYERSNSGFFERVCLDNNRDVNGGEVNLTPPKE
jgi:hypothetical protein